MAILSTFKLQLHKKVEMRMLISINFSGEFSGKGLEIKHFQLTKYKIFLRKGVLPPSNPRQGASPLDPHIIFLLLAGV